MLTMDQLVALFGLIHKDRELQAPASAPTAASIALINDTLGISLPDSYIEFATRCPAYNQLLASIGEDYGDGHILSINEEFHCESPNYCVPYWFIMLNHGHDQDCLGFDSRWRGDNGEHPVLYWDASQGLNYVPEESLSSFQENLERTLLHSAKSIDKDYVEAIIGKRLGT